MKCLPRRLQLLSLYASNKWPAILLAMLMAVIPAHSTVAEGSAQRLVVSPQGPYVTIQAALADAHAGDTIEVRHAVYRGPIVVDKSVQVEGIGYPIVDNGGEGTVVTLAAPDIVFRGFELRGSGNEPDRDHSGIIITAPGIVAENNRIVDSLFGIFVSRAKNAIVRGNEITSKAEYDVARKGDAIRLWYSPGSTVEKNHVHNARDLVIWYSSNVKIRDNLIEHGRYGVHLMYCDDTEIEGNRILDNSVGIYTMYSNGIVLRDNLIRGQRGPSGYALGFKDADNLEVVSNTLVDNRAGVYMDGTPFTPQGYSKFRDNILAFNDVGVIVLPAVRGNEFENNTFWENVEQVSIQGGGNLGANRWQSNYWSDYAGFDSDSDGRGELPYRAEHFFEGLVDREPLLRALIYSPAQQAIEFASSTFPVVKPKSKLTDPTPSVLPNQIPPTALVRTGNSNAMMLTSVALLGLCGMLGGLGWKKSPNLTTASGRPARTHLRGGAKMSDSIRNGPSQGIGLQSSESDTENLPMSIRVVDVSKQYGKTLALDHVTFSASPGEAIALWGPNGAGKTTLLKALLGLIRFEGHIKVMGCDVKRQSKAARRQVGYVPQEAVFYDQTVRATMAFYARLKKADSFRAAALLEQVGLAEHMDKPVPALSGGLKQRLALAVALLADPPILLLDEPTANLDSTARRDYLALLASLHHQGKTIVFASHRIDEVESLADRVVVVKNGQVTQTLTPAQLRAEFTPQVQLTLWIPEREREQALAYLTAQGWRAHYNGHGTVVVRVHAGEKLKPLNGLNSQGIAVLDFEMEGLTTWN